MGLEPRAAPTAQASIRTPASGGHHYPHALRRAEKTYGTYSILKFRVFWIVEESSTLANDSACLVSEQLLGGWEQLVAALRCLASDPLATDAWGRSGGVPLSGPQPSE